VAFALTYDNLSSSNRGAAERFDLLASRTRCPFALGCHAWCAPDWNPDLSSATNVARSVLEFARFDGELASRTLDLFVSEVAGPDISDLSSLARYLRSFLSAIQRLVPGTTDEWMDGIESRSWDFVFLRRRYFVLTFAPFYPSRNPRYSCQEGHGFIVLQPDETFARHNISQSNPLRHEISTRVRDLFVGDGFDYDLELVTKHPKAERYIKPIRAGEHPVRWWFDSPKTNVPRVP
jgi:hypothetical protein